MNINEWRERESSSHQGNVLFPRKFLMILERIGRTKSNKTLLLVLKLLEKMGGFFKNNFIRRSRDSLGSLQLAGFILGPHMGKKVRAIGQMMGLMATQDKSHGSAYGEE